MEGKTKMRQNHRPEDWKDERAEHQGHLIQRGQEDAEEAGCENLSSIHEAKKIFMPTPLIAEPVREVTRRFCDRRAGMEELAQRSEKEGGG